MGTHWRFVWAQEYPVAVNDETFTARTKLTGDKKNWNTIWTEKKELFAKQAPQTRI